MTVEKQWMKTLFRLIWPNAAMIFRAHLIAMGMVTLFAWAASPARAVLRDLGLAPYDIRLADPAVRRKAARAREASGATAKSIAEARLQAAVPSVRISFDPVLGTPCFVRSTQTLLTGPAPADQWRRTARSFVTDHAALFGVKADLIESCRVSRNFVTPRNGARSVTWQQQIEGLDLMGATLKANFSARGELINISSRLLPISARPPKIAAPLITAEQAIAAASKHLGIVLTEALSRIDGSTPTRAQFKPTVDFKGAPRAERLYFPLTRAEVRPVWVALIPEPGPGNVYRVAVDAVSSRVLFRQNLTHYASTQTASYRVYTSDSPSPFSPGSLTPDGFQPPLADRTLETAIAFDLDASPNGWIADGGNETLGNNVDAHTDLDDDNLADEPRPLGNPARVFDFTMNLAQDPSTYRAASVAQLFYWNNWAHDRFYQLGFDEAAGNFQSDNFGRGGFGNDAVLADAQDGGNILDADHVNNANFSTPPDGFRPRMQMFIFTSPFPARDGSLDADVVLHEYAHGLSDRLHQLTLVSTQSMGLSEGWSDFYALSLLAEPGDDPRANYPAGGYVAFRLGGLSDNYYFGIRRFPYSTSMGVNPLTFADLDPNQIAIDPGVPISPIMSEDPTEVHNMGEVWCNVLWCVRALMIEKHGFAGNEIMLRLVTDGMKLSPDNPDFLQARDAILQADLMNHNGDNLCELWTGFAGRGMGLSAVSPGANTTEGIVEAFDAPFTACVTSKGRIRFSAPAFSCASEVAIILVDEDRAGAGSILIEIASSTGDRKLVALNEDWAARGVSNPKNSGVFRGSLSTSDAPGVGVIEVADGGALTATYRDESDDAGNPAEVTAVARIDCLAPVVSGVRIDDTQIDEITLSFNTNEPAAAVVRAGLDCGIQPRMVSTSAGMTHTVTFFGLDPCTRYFFSVESTDVSGNRSFATDAGACVAQNTLAFEQSFFDDFELGSTQPGWAHSAPLGLDNWEIRDIGAAFNTMRGFSYEPGQAVLTDASLVSPDLQGGEQLIFSHAFDTEIGFDGAVLEISTDGGQTWDDLGAEILENGYNQTISDCCGSPIAGRMAWTGGSFETLSRVKVDLGAFPGTVRIRFRFVSDTSIASDGWKIDDVRLGAQEACIVGNSARGWMLYQ